jgi:hypothetical protein
MVFLSKGLAFTAKLKFIDCGRRDKHAEETSTDEVLDLHGLHGG